MKPGIYKYLLDGTTQRLYPQEEFTSPELWVPIKLDEEFTLLPDGSLRKEELVYIKRRLVKG